MNKRERTYERIYAEYYQRIFSYLQRLTENSRTAEELTKETFVAAYGRLSRYSGRCTMITWLQSLAAEKFLKYLHGNDGVIRYDLYIAEPDADISNDAGFRWKREIPAENLGRVLTDIPEMERMIFLLHLFGETEFGELADMYGISARSAQLIFIRTKERIKEELNND